MSLPQNTLRIVCISLVREKKTMLGSREEREKIAGRGRYSADIRRVQKEIDDLRASGRTGEKRQRNTYQ